MNLHKPFKKLKRNSCKSLRASCLNYHKVIYLCFIHFLIFNNLMKQVTIYYMYHNFVLLNVKIRCWGWGGAVRLSVVIPHEDIFGNWIVLCCHGDRNSTGSPVCQDLQDKVFRCYTENHKKTLLCSADVRAFFECVERARAVSLFSVHWL